MKGLNDKKKTSSMAGSWVNHIFPLFLGRGSSMVKPFPRKYAAVWIAILQNFVSGAVSVTIVFIG